jgi:hypothetical protein
MMLEERKGLSGLSRDITFFDQYSTGKIAADIGIVIELRRVKILGTFLH